MFFGKKKEGAIVAQLTKPPPGQSYWAVVRRHFGRNRLAVWALRSLWILLVIALFADFIANEKPLYCKIGGQTYWPVFHQYAVDVGLAKWEPKFYTTDWNDHKYESVIWPPIPYSATTLDSRNANFKSPFGPQEVKSRRYWHWLGTDQLGRDVAAGMVRGTRIAMLVGVIAMSVAALIGILLGALAGFFGDERLQISRARLLLNLITLPLAVFYGFMARSFEITESGAFWEQLLLSLLIVLAIVGIANLATRLFSRMAFLNKKITIAVDILVMRFIEIFNSIPKLLLLLAILAVIDQASIFNIMVIIGLVSWTGIARFVRAEFLRIRNLDYMVSAEAMGFGAWRLIRKHALPNALTPVLITIAFGVAGAILVEAFLSFLGLGIALEEVSWGKLLSAARHNFKAWWLALFPGLAIFLTVTIFNLIGDGLAEAINPGAASPPD